ncbi:hypothetical protein Gorai_004655 [Gossypium raimondii]|uniref:Uncharacterized protein n=1 Tax=Gossypium raimondii TaxID=29730 RepID=A0A7J8QJN4_GOSRA|nr:hypothetical protein [Gossypium raimondii]
MWILWRFKRSPQRIFNTLLPFLTQIHWTLIHLLQFQANLPTFQDKSQVILMWVPHQNPKEGQYTSMLQMIVGRLMMMQLKGTLLVSRVMVWINWLIN